MIVDLPHVRVLSLGGKAKPSPGYAAGWNEFFFKSHEPLALRWMVRVRWELTQGKMGELLDLCVSELVTR